MKEKVKVCPECGVAFVPATGQQKYCSKECSKSVIKRREHARDNDYHIFKQRREEAKAKESYQRNWTGKGRLAELQRLAKEAGMSYGKYMAVLRMWKMRGDSL